MAQSRAGSEDRRSYWRDLIEQWERSGGTQEAFCAARGVAVSSFRWWKWKLGAERAGAPQSRRPKRPAAPKAGPAFIPVRVVERGDGFEPAACGGSFELWLAGGVRLRVPRDFEAESLARLLAVLGGQRGC